MTQAQPRIRIPTQRRAVPKKAMRKVVGLVACGKTKLDHSAPAKDLYVGNLFKWSRAWVEKNCDEWFILSAKHGLLDPEEVIEPYERRMPTNYEDRKHWSRRVNDGVFNRWCMDGCYPEEKADGYGGHKILWNPDHPSIPRLIILAGVDYRIAFEGSFVDSDWCHRIPFECPMRGLELGEQLSWLKDQLGL